MMLRTAVVACVAHTALRGARASESSAAITAETTWRWSSDAEWNEWDARTTCALDQFATEARWTLSGARHWLAELGGEFAWELRALGGAEDVVSSGVIGNAAFTEATPGGDVLDARGLVGGDEGLQCEFDPEFCVPELVAIRLPDIDETADRSLQTNHSIVLEFKHATNRPPVQSVDAIAAIVAFSEYVGDNLTGSWSTDGRVLAITVLEIDLPKVKPVRELMTGLLRTTIRSTPQTTRPKSPAEISISRSYSLPLSFRVQRVGQYFVRVTTPIGITLRSPNFEVVSCDSAQLILADGTKTTDSAAHASQQLRESDLTAPSVFVPGVLTHGGDQGFTVPESTIDMASPGSWAMSFWLFLTQDSTGSFRTLFFHGDGSGEQRTPSVWWTPDERRLAMRVSTNASTDVGLDSVQELPLNEWIHFGFNFHNCSPNVVAEEGGGCFDGDPSSGVSWFYAIEFFVNGQMDQRVRVHEQVMANTGPLHIGKGPWTDGMQGFISNLRVFPIALRSEEFEARFLLEKSAHPKFSDVSRSRDARHTAFIKETQREASRLPSSQISYLRQMLRQESQGDAEHSPSHWSDDDTRRVMASCDRDVWDRLLEMAEAGNAMALHEVGVALLFGTYSYPDECTYTIAVEQNTTLARTMLRRALAGGYLMAGKSLSLALEVDSTDNDDDLAPFKAGLYHIAASTGSSAAFAVLGNIYASESATTGIAAYHYYHAAIDAAAAFHERGKEPLHEMNRLYDALQQDITQGQLGEDDELIQFQKLRADKDGDVESMAAMGDLYYWGARGVPRDQEQALRYFERAAQAGHVSSQAALAGMLLKGEGADQDNATAIDWYEKAAMQNHTRALNGLGFIHFYGSSGVPENKSLALEFFERAALNEEDGDSLFNAGYCYAIGVGAPRNMSRAIFFYDIAARKFGHFDAVFELGKVWMHGVEDAGISPDLPRALPYLKAASDVGRWGTTMRKGFEQFLAGEWRRAAVHYHDAREFGYPVATSNLAYLYDEKLVLPRNLQSEKRAFEFLTRAFAENNDREVLVRLGDYHYYGRAGLPVNPGEAIRWYSRASAEGVDVGAFSVGHMYEYGIGVDVNLERAQRYYQRAEELAAATSSEAFLAAHLMLVRLSLRRWLRHTSLERLLEWRGMDDNSIWFSDAAHCFTSVPIAVTVVLASIALGSWYLRSQR